MFTNNECCDFDIFIDQSKKDRLVEAGVNYVIVNPDSVTDLWLEDEYGNERSLSDISYYYKTMLVAGEDFDVIELVDYIPQRIVDAMYEGSTAFSGYSGVIMWIGEEYTNHSNGTRYTVSPDLEIMSNTKYEISDDVILEIKDVKTAVNSEYGRDISNEASILVLDFLMDDWDDDEYDADDIDGHIISALDHLIEDTKCIALQGGKFVLDWK